MKCRSMLVAVTAVAPEAYTFGYPHGMPYDTHPFANTPPDDSVIWRYMDLPKFLLLLDQKALYFPILPDLADKWETALDHAEKEFITGHFPSLATGGVVSSMQEFISRVVVNCWYNGDSESVAMWALYTSTPYGIAIESRVGRFKKALRIYGGRVYLGLVEYLDHEAPVTTSLAPPLGQINAVRPVLHKRLCYKHECELRAFTVLPSNQPPPTNGVQIPVYLNDLIEGVTLGPAFPNWCVGLVEEGLVRSNLSIPVAPSDAARLPTDLIVLAR
jgi:hypothetical protein